MNTGSAHWSLIGLLISKDTRQCGTNCRAIYRSSSLWWRYFNKKLDIHWHSWPHPCIYMLSKCQIIYVCMCVYIYIYTHTHFFFHGLTALAGLGLLTVEVSRSHSSDTPHLVGFLWMSDRPIAETSNWQLTTDRHPCPSGIRTRSPSKLAAADYAATGIKNIYIQVHYFIWQIPLITIMPLLQVSMGHSAAIVYIICELAWSDKWYHCIKQWSCMKHK